MSNNIKHRINLICQFTLILFVSSACVHHDRRTAKAGTVSLVKVDSVVLQNSEPLFGKFVEQFQISETGDIWLFAERDQNRVFTFDNRGRFIHAIGERGKGPKGIMHVSGFDMNEENEVIIYDAAQRMLKVFDLDGELVHSTSFMPEGTLWGHPYVLHAFRDQLLLTVTEAEFVRAPHQSKLLALVNMDGSVDTVFGKHDPFTKEDNTYSAENTVYIDGDTLFTSSVGSPFIQVYNSETFQQTDYFGKQTTSFAIPEQEVHANLPISEIQRRSAGSTVSAGVYGTDRFIILHLQILTEEFFDTIDFSTKENILVLYDRSSREFIKEIPVPHMLGAVHNNKLYFVEDLNPDQYTIGVYKLSPQK